jgi:HK97 family phage major capsid protein
MGTTYDSARSQELHTERANLLAKSRRIVNAAKADGRELNPTEQSAVDAALERVAQLEPELKAQQNAAFKAVMGLTNAEYDPGEGQGTFDAAATEGFLNAIRSKGAYRAEVRRDRLHTKAAITTGTLIPPTGEGVAPTLYPNAGPVAITDLMPNQAVGGGTVRYYRISSGTAAVVAEGAAKPDAGIAASAVDVALAKIAATLKVSDELSEDAPFMLGNLQRALVGAVVSKENEECISTWSGTSGILTATGTAATAVDVFADAIASAQALGLNPSAILVNPATLATIRKAKASTSGVYVADPLAAGPTTLHGVPLYAVPVAGVGIGWVIDSTGLTYFRRSGVTFELGTDSDDFTKNLRTARAETRGKCGVQVPSAVTKVTLT